MTEHAGLRRFYQRRSGLPIDIEYAHRATLLFHFHAKMQALGYAPIALSCASRHVHGLAQLPSDLQEIKRLIGQCKQYASHQLRDVLPGTIWSRNGEFKLIKDHEHQVNAFHYIIEKQEPGAVVWSIRPQDDWINRADNPGLRSTSDTGVE